MTPRRSALLALALLVGCSSDGDEDAGSATADEATEETAGGAGGGTVESEGAGGATPAVVQLGRDVVRTAEIRLVVEDVAVAAAEVTRIAEETGGFQASSEIDLAGATPTGSVVVRVPTGAFTATMAAIGQLGEVTGSTSDSEDVTGAVVDLEARVAAARSSVERVAGFLERTGDVGELAAVERELLTRESELEALLGQLAALRDRVDLATITARLGVEPGPELAAVDDDDLPTPAAALASGWGAFAAVVQAVVAAGAFALPFAILAVPAALAWRLWRRRPPATTG